MRTSAQVLLSLDGARVATISDDGTARLWDTELGTELRQFRHPKAVKVEALPCALALSSDGKRLLVKWERKGERSGTGTTVSLWDVEAPRETRQFRLRPQSGIFLFSPDARRVLTSSDQTTLWDTETGQVIRRYE